MSHKELKETWPEKEQLRVEIKQTNRQNKCATTDKEPHNLIRGTLANTVAQDISPDVSAWKSALYGVDGTVKIASAGATRGRP